MLVKASKDAVLHWTTEPLVFVAGEETEVPDSLVPMVLALGGFAVAQPEAASDEPPVRKPGRPPKAKEE